MANKKEPIDIDQNGVITESEKATALNDKIQTNGEKEYNTATSKEWWEQGAIPKNEGLTKVGDKWLTKDQLKHWTGLSTPRQQNEYLESLPVIDDTVAEIANKKNPETIPKTETPKTDMAEQTDTEIINALKDPESKAIKEQKKEDEKFIQDIQKSVDLKPIGDNTKNTASSSQINDEDLSTVSKKTNPNLQALDETRKDIHDKAIEDKIELEPEIKKYMEQAESLIDPNYLENIPRNIWRDFARGDFGRTKIDEEVEREYNKIKHLDYDTLNEKGKALVDKYNKQKQERRDARSTFGSLLLNQIATGLSNAGVAAQGGQGNKKSTYQNIQESKLAGGLERYNKKYADMANMDTSLLNSAYQNDREIDEQLKKVYADKSVQPYLTKLDLDTRRIFVNYVAAMGKNLELKDLPGLMAGLWAYQDTGNMNKSTMDLLGKAGSGVLELVKLLGA